MKVFSLLKPTTFLIKHKDLTSTKSIVDISLFGALSWLRKFYISDLKNNININHISSIIYNKKILYGHMLSNMNFYNVCNISPKHLLNIKSSLQNFDIDTINVLAYDSSMILTEEEFNNLLILCEIYIKE